MLSVGLVPGLKSVAMPTMAPASIKCARGSVMRQAEMEAAAGKQSADDVGEGECVNVIAIDFFEVIGAGGLQFDGEARGAGVGELFGVDARDEASGASRGQDAAGLRDGERAAVAVDVAEFGESSHGDRGNPLIDQKIHIGVRAFAEFVRHDVRAEERGANIHADGADEGAREARAFSARSSSPGRSRFWPRWWWCRGRRTR